MSRFVLALVALALIATQVRADDGYVLTNLVANKQIYAPQMVNPRMLNGWGLAIRPAGAGGHFWINNTDSGTTSLYVGDVDGEPLFQDEAKLVEMPAARGQKEPANPTGIVFNGRIDEFIVSHDGITGASKFIFATEQGTIVGWTEQQKPDGAFIRPQHAKTVSDRSGLGAIYKGLAISNKESGHNRLYAADFGRNRVDVFNEAFRPVKLGGGAFRAPARLIPANYAPFNIQEVNGTLYVTYAKLTKEPGEEEKGAGKGYVAQFDFNGNLLNVLEGKGFLNAPWGIAQAPKQFGPYGNHLLVGNFGDGRIVAFDPATGRQAGILKTRDGQPMEVDGLWGMLFGNGESLGDKDALYFAASPNDEKDGVFGKISYGR